MSAQHALRADLRVGFAGTPEFAAAALQAIIQSGFTVALVLTQPDRPAGRGMQLQASAVKTLALRHGLALAQPSSLRLDGKYPDEAAAAKAQIDAARLDVLVVAAYGLILPQWVLDAPARLGCLNIHASLLPRWRGAAPIHRAIEAGDAQTGITIMQMDAGLDTGAMIRTDVVPIPQRATTAQLHDSLATLGAQAIVAVLDEALKTSARLISTPQPPDGITYAEKISKTEAAIDPRQSAQALGAKIRALNPAPGAHGVVNGEAFKIWNCYFLNSNKPNEYPGLGAIFLQNNEVCLQASDGVLAITEVQKPGAKRVAAIDWWRSLSAEQRANGVVLTQPELKAKA
jgi:methionyl-tRNA formyltransferase